ncbi:uroporphyrinogen decarboxylase family protein [Planctomycetota bacterium]
MTPREVVQAAIRFETPDRLPVEMGSLGYSDLYGVGLQHDSERFQTGAGLDEWGCFWTKTEVTNMGQVTAHPLTDLSMVEDYPFPDPDDKALYERIAEALQDPDIGDRYVNIGQFMVLFERMQALLGFETVLEGLYLEPEAMGLLADRLVAYDIAKINHCGEMFGDQIQGFGGTDDWGTQLAIFVSPDKWREFFLPRYKKIWGAAKAWGWDARLHSCGRVNEALPLMIEAGLADINLQQPKALGIDAIGESVAGKICFTSLCDIQHTLPAGDTDEINREAEHLLSAWSTPEGGFIFSDYGDGAAIGVPDPIKHVMFDAFLDRDPYRKVSGVDHPALKAVRG